MANEIEIPGYEILGEIGQGGQATVYRARQRSLDRRMVAIKVYPSGSINGRDRRRFDREVQALNDLAGNTNVVRLDRADIADGRPYLVMELCNGSLADRVAAGPLAPAEVTAIAVRVCEALRVAHARGIVHRDLKPSNLLWRTGHGRAELVVADFGTALAETTGDRTQTMIRSKGYTAPEVEDGQPATVRSDVYSLGATLFMLLEGRTPVPGERPAAPWVPERLADTIAVAVSRDPRRRFGSVVEFLRSLSGAPAGTATVEVPREDRTALDWLAGADLARKPELWPPVVVPEASDAPPRLGRYGLVGGLVLTLPLAVGYARSALLAVVLAGAALALAGYWLVDSGNARVSRVAVAALVVDGAVLLAWSIGLAGTGHGFGATAALAAGVGIALALAGRLVACRQRDTIARQRERKLDQQRLVVRVEDTFFSSDEPAPAWLMNLMDLQSVLLYRLPTPNRYVATSGSHLALFEVVTWPPGLYQAIGERPFVMRDGRPYRQGLATSTPLIEAVTWFGREVPEATAQAVLVVTADGVSGDGVLVREAPDGRFLLATPETATRVGGEFLARSGYQVDTVIAGKLLDLTCRAR